MLSPTAWRLLRAAVFIITVFFRGEKRVRLLSVPGSVGTPISLKSHVRLSYSLLNISRDLTLSLSLSLSVFFSFYGVGVHFNPKHPALFTVVYQAYFLPGSSPCCAPLPSPRLCPGGVSPVLSPYPFGSVCFGGGEGGEKEAFFPRDTPVTPPPPPSLPPLLQWCFPKVGFSPGTPS